MPRHADCSCVAQLAVGENATMTDLMNVALLLITFGLGIGFVLACERLK